MRKRETKRQGHGECREGLHPVTMMARMGHRPSQCSSPWPRKTRFGKGRGKCWWDYIPKLKARRVKRPAIARDQREMRVRIPPLECSLRAAVSPLLVASAFSKSTANARRTTSICNRLVAGSSPAGSTTCGSVAQLVEQERLSQTSSPWTNNFIWPDQLRLTEPGEGRSPIRTNRITLADAGGTTLVRAPAYAGGRWFDSTPG